MSDVGSTGDSSTTPETCAIPPILREDRPRPWDGRRFHAALLPCLLFLAATSRVIWLGTHLDPAPPVPESPADGIQVRLVTGDRGRPEVHASRVLPRPCESVWRKITDYESFPQTFSGIQAVDATVIAPGTYRLSGTASTLVGAYAIDIEVRHEITGRLRQVWWEDADPDVLVNRGRWILEDLGNDSTRVTYKLDLEARGWPGFLVRTYLRWGAGRLLDELGVAMESSR